MISGIGTTVTSVIPSASEGPHKADDADKLSLDYVTALARSLGPSRTGVVCAARDDE
jgi:hypothetical protein